MANNVTEKVDICFGKGRKQCVKMSNCWLQAFSPFPTMLSYLSMTEVIILVRLNLPLNDPRKNILKTMWEKEKMLVTSIFSFFLNAFLPINERNYHFSKIEFAVGKCFKF